MLISEEGKHSAVKGDWETTCGYKSSGNNATKLKRNVELYHPAIKVTVG